MVVKFENDGRILEVFLEGELDHHNVKDIREKIDSEIRRTTPTKIILNLKGVPFSDSSGIALIMGRYKLANSYGGKVEVCNMSAQVKKVLSFGSLEKLVSIN